MAKRFGSPSAPSTLEPRLGVMDAAAIVVSNAIGGGIFVLASAVLVLNEIWSRPGPALAGLGVMAAGVPVDWWMRAEGARFRARQQVASDAGGA